MLNWREKNTVINLLRAGLPVSEIARRIRRSVMTIYRLKNNPTLRKNKVTSKKISPEIEKQIKSLLRRGITNGKKIFTALKENGFIGSYSLLNRYLKNIKNNYKEKGLTRYETEPGEQAQVDWGSFRKIKMNGREERLHFFAYLLGYSRMFYVEFTIKQNVQTLLNCHIHAFEKLGITKGILYDNMKTVILKREKLPDGTEEKHYNPAFLDFARHFGFEIELSPPYYPQAKGKVERAVKYIKDNFLQGMKFGKNVFSLEELNERVQLWNDKVASQRQHGTRMEKPDEAWRREKSLLRFPNEFQPYTISSFRDYYSHKDGTIFHKYNYYSLPLEYARKRVQGRVVNKNGLSILEIYYQHKVIAEHLVSNERGKWIRDKKHYEQYPPQTNKIRRMVNQGRDRKLPNPIIYIRGPKYYEKVLAKKKYE